MTAPGANVALASAAFPRLLRRLTLLLLAALAIGAVAASIELRRVAWTLPSMLLFGLAWLCIAWMGYWMLNSRTRVDDDTIVQTWLWTKRAHASDVSSMRLVHLSAVDAIVAPRLLVRMRSGGMLWFQAEDAMVLRTFMDRVVQHQTAALMAVRDAAPPPSSDRP